MRDYDPTTGRYMQADPLGLVDGASVYGYARQNPGRYIDPTGEIGVPGAIGGAIAGGVAGYLTTGCWQGAAVGAVAGVAGATGGALGLTSLGSGAIGFAGAFAGQIGSNKFANGCGCVGEPMPFIDLISSRKFWFTNIGGAFGAYGGSAIGSRAAYRYGRWWYGVGPLFNPSREAVRAGVESFISEGIGGIGSGIGEFVGSRIGQ